MERNNIAFGLCLVALAAGLYDALPSIRVPRIPPVPPVPPVVRPFFPLTPPVSPSPVPAPPSAGTAEAAPLFSPTDLPKLDGSPAEPSPSVDGKSAGAQAPVYVDEVTGISVTKPTILQISIPGCAPCIEFMEKESKKYIDVGWDVRDVKDPTIVMPSYPSYRIITRDKQYTHVGKLTTKTLRLLLGRPAPPVVTTAASSETVTTRYPVVDVTNYSGVDYKINGREWTEASLRAHLYTHSNHRHPYGSLDGLPLSYLKMLHTVDHENAKSSVVARQSVYVRASGGCPPGGCPPQTGRVTYRTRNR